MIKKQNEIHIPFLYHSSYFSFQKIQTMEGYDLLVQVNEDVDAIERTYKSSKRSLTIEQSSTVAAKILILRFKIRKAEDLLAESPKGKGLDDIRAIKKAANETRDLVGEIMASRRKGQNHDAILFCTGFVFTLLVWAMEFYSGTISSRGEGFILMSIGPAMMFTGFWSFLNERFGVPMLQF